MSDHECFRCPECGSCPACAADALDNLIEEAERHRERLDQYEAYDITVDSALRDREQLAAAESRAERLEKALAPFIVPESYSTAEEACRRNAAMDWCAVHSFRWPCPVTAARAALAAEEEGRDE